MNKRVITVVGARPNFIKAAAVSRVLRDNSALDETIIHTGQHYDQNMSRTFFDELNIPAPKYNLNVHDCSNATMVSRMVIQIEEILQVERPDAVLVYGDTNSTLAGALAAASTNTKLIHIEAGLRSFNKQMPEEKNRVITDHISDLLLCPTTQAVKNLANEGLREAVFHTGDVMYDATLFALEQVKKNAMLQDLICSLPHFALLTIHRAQATESQAALAERLAFAQQYARDNNLRLIFPVHPRTRKLLQDVITPDGVIRFIDPLSYMETQAYLSKAKYVITDSGGLQKEAYFHGVPCITLRSETEWTETIEAGWNRLWNVPNYNARKQIHDYGTGQAAKHVYEYLMEHVCQ